jgi:hypothetical protein
LDINIQIRKIKISTNITLIGMRNWHAYSVEKHDHPVWWKKIVFLMGKSAQN